MATASNRLAVEFCKGSTAFDDIVRVQQKASHRLPFRLGTTTWSLTNSAGYLESPATTWAEHLMMDDAAMSKYRNSKSLIF